MNLKKKAVSGVRWTGAATAINLALQAVTLAVLTRLLGPGDFGLMGMITVVIGFARAFADMGISNAIIYKQDSSSDELSSLYWLNLAMGLFIFVLLFAMEPLVESFYMEPRIRLPYYLAAFIFLLLAPGQQFQALLQKHLQFKTLSHIQVISNIIGSAASITLAYMGYGVISLVFGQVLTQGTTTIMLFLSPHNRWLPRFHFKTGDLKDYIGFGLFQMGERILNYFSTNVDYLIIGRLLGAEPLGYYTLAYRIISMATQRINPVVTRVAFPMFAKIQNDNETLKKGYSRVLQLLSLTVIPFLIGALTIGAPFVAAIFGEKWLPSVILIQIMALAGCLKTITNPTGSVLLAKGRADIGFVWNLITWVIRVAVIWKACYMGLAAVAWGVLIVQVFDSSAIQWIICRLIGMKPMEFAKPLIPALAGTAIMGAGILAIKTLLARAGILTASYIGMFLILFVSGALIYMATLFIKYRETLIYYRDLLLMKGES